MFVFVCVCVPPVVLDESGDLRGYGLIPGLLSPCLPCPARALPCTLIFSARGSWSSFDEIVNVQQGFVDKDAVLRRAGFPQSLIYILRAANLTYAEIGSLPIPYSIPYSSGR